jgi:hypothetical protein
MDEPRNWTIPILGQRISRFAQGAFVFGRDHNDSSSQRVGRVNPIEKTGVIRRDAYRQRAVMTGYGAPFVV